MIFRRFFKAFFIGLIAFVVNIFTPLDLWALDGITVDDTSETETVITLQVELCPEPVDDPATPEAEGLTAEEIQAFIDAQDPAVTAIWNVCTSRFRIRRGATRKIIRFEFEFTVLDNCDVERDPNKKRFKLHPGSAPEAEGRNADTINLWVENTSRTLAHELGHVMGLGEEYGYNGGPTRQNIMGRGSSTKITPYHVMTILFVNADNPEAAEKRKRVLMKTLLRLADQTTARQIAAENGITAENYDAYKDQFSANGTQMQPGVPSRSE